MLVLMNTEDMLGDLGCESVFAAATVEEALALIGSEKFDLALLDMNLDGDNTHSVADALAERGIKFAFATGYDAHDLRESYGDRPVLRKPFRPTDFAEKLKHLIA